MTLDKKLVNILACPDDKNPLHYQKEKKAEILVCTKCGRKFPIIEGIPHLLPKNNTK